MNPDGFAHYKQSVRGCTGTGEERRRVESYMEVRDGILGITEPVEIRLLEGQVARLRQDRLYIHHDMDDAQRAGIISEDDIPITLRCCSVIQPESGSIHLFMMI